MTEFVGVALKFRNSEFVGDGELRALEKRPEP